MKTPVLGIAIICGLLCCHACGKQEGQSNRAAGSTDTSTRFERLDPSQTGITFKPGITEDYRYNFSMDPYIYNGGGVAVLDVNNDGLQDLLFTARLQGCHLYLNKGGMKFEDISEKSGISKYIGLKTGVVVVDINADGWQDLYICRTWLQPLPDRRNLLFVNNHDGTFTEKAAEYGLDDLSASQQAVFFDYDLDGDLDCYVVNHPVDFKSMNNLDPSQGDARKQQPKNEYESDRLYRNDGGKFTDVSKSAGINNRAFGLSVLAADFNEDGYPDLYVGNDFIMPDFLYINNKNGTFTDRAGDWFRHTSNHTMGSDLADINGDGYADLLTLDMLAEPWDRRKRLMSTMQLERDRKMTELGYGRQVMRNTLQLGPLQDASEIGYLSGMYATDWSWAPLIADFDLDGKRDVFISNGIKRDMNDLDFFLYTADSINQSGGISPKRFPNFEQYAALMPSQPVHNYCFHNKGDLQFEEVSKSWGFDHPGFSNGAAYADLDNDGDLDLIVNNLEAPPALYANQAADTHKNNWLQVKCKGPAQNPFGLGARVRAYAGGQLVFTQEMLNVRGFYSSVEPIWEIGLGSQTTVDKIQVEWPGGKLSELTNVTANQRIVLDFAESKPGKLTPLNAPGNPLFKVVKNGLDFVHHENTFEDFNREKLLPHRFSDEGPCLAKGDINGDGLEDLFVGGAGGQAGKLYAQQKNGTFKTQAAPDLDADLAFEDCGALFFDADGDQDLDLYVVSGGNEAVAGSTTYQDRLYLNNGAGAFKRAADALPVEGNAGSRVIALDYDQDGDLDLVIGGRVVPGAYPTAPKTMLLENDKGHFTDVSSTTAPGMQQIGMVSDLGAADLDKDGRAEIVLCGDWMGIQVFKWNGKQFDNQSAAFGLQGAEGWWNCLIVSDLDGDGDLDIAAGNEGLNTRYRASDAAPLGLYAKDFDQNGAIDPILTEQIGGAPVPIANRDQLALQQLPVIKKKFPRYAAYAKATLGDLFSDTELSGAGQWQIHTLESSWFENKDGKFIRHALPMAAQIAPVQRMLSGDFNGDGVSDVLLVGNDYGTDIETYRIDAFRGCLLQGGGNGQFTALPYWQTGFKADQDARDLLELAGANGRRTIVVGNNNGPLLVFEIRKSTQ